MDILPFKIPSQQLAESEMLPPKISKLADVDPHAEIANGVEIGPFCVVGPNAKIGAGTKLMNGVTILGHVTLGAGNTVFPGAIIGGDPQDVSYRGSPTQVIVGDRNVIRECVTINRGSEKEEGFTRVGSDCLLMGCSHVGHDCVLGDRVILGHGSLLGGHSQVHSFATISGACAATHFSSIGSYSFVGAASLVLQDIPPFMLADGNPARCKCTNIVALKRNNFPNNVILALNEAFRLLYRGRVGLDNAREVLKSKNMLVPEVERLFAFLACAREGRHGRARQLAKPAAA